MHNRKPRSNQRDLIVRHITLLVFAFVASLLFSGLNLIDSKHIPVTTLLAFISVEWVYFQHKNATTDKMN